MAIPPRMLIRTAAKAAFDAYSHVVLNRTVETDVRREALLITLQQLLKTDEIPYDVEIDPFGEWAMVDGVFFSHSTPKPGMYGSDAPSLQLYVQPKPQYEISFVEIKGLVDLGRAFEQYSEEAFVHQRDCCVVARTDGEQLQIHMILLSDLEFFRSLGFEGPQ